MSCFEIFRYRFQESHTKHPTNVNKIWNLIFLIRNYINDTAIKGIYFGIIHSITNFWNVWKTPIDKFILYNNWKKNIRYFLWQKHLIWKNKLIFFILYLMKFHNPFLHVIPKFLEQYVSSIRWKKGIFWWASSVHCSYIHSGVFFPLSLLQDFSSCINLCSNMA